MIIFFAVYAMGYIGLTLGDRFLEFYCYELFHNLMSALGVLIIVIIVTRFFGSNKVTIFIGSISYEIYLYHELFIEIFRNIIQDKFIYIFSVYSLTLITAFLMKKVKERVLKK